VEVLQQSTKINEYLKNVCEQIRWKRAHESVSQELENHILDQKAAYVQEGLEEEAATDKAIKQMGDAVSIGMELDRAYRPKPEWRIILLMGILLLMGFIIRILVTTGTEFSWMISKSIVWMVIGMICMVATYFLDFTIMGRYPKLIFFGLTVIAILLTMIGVVVNGRNFYLQFVYLLFPTAFAGIVYSMRGKGYIGIIVSGLFFVVSVIVGKEALPSKIFVYSLTCLIILTRAIKNGYFNVNKLKAILIVYIPVFLVSIRTLIKIFSTQYQWERIQSLIKPYLYPMGSGYVSSITKSAINSAKLFGQSEQAVKVAKLLPDIYNDSLVTYIIQRFGWISFIIIMIPILLFIIRCFILSSRQKSILGKLVATSIILTFSMQVIVYVCFNLGFQLIATISLPLISYGGSSTIINMSLIGLMLSVFRTGDLVTDKSITSNKYKLFEYMGGKIIIKLNTKQ
jgi:cell division protein FtsW (lipid II flippase)